MAYSKEKRSEYDRQYYQTPNGKEVRRKADKKYKQTPAGKASKKKYAQSPDGKASQKKAGNQYSQTSAGKASQKKSNKKYNQTPDGKEAIKRANSHHRRLDFNPLNESFSGSEAHHINTKDVIYIPKKLHRSIPHCLETRQGMTEINTLAIRFLINK